MSAITAFLFIILSIHTIHCSTASDKPSKGDRGDVVTSETVSSTGTKDLTREATGWERPTYGTQTWYPPQGNNKGSSRTDYTGYQQEYQQRYPSHGTSNDYGRYQGSYVQQDSGGYPGNVPPGHGNNKGGWSSAGSGWSGNYPGNQQGWSGNYPGNQHGWSGNQHGRPWPTGGHAQGNYKGGSTSNQGWYGGGQSGYGGGQSGYVVGHSGYGVGQSGYGGGQSGYGGGHSGYGGGQSGYGGGQSGYGGGQSGYGGGQSGYGDGWYVGNQISPSGSYNWPTSSGYRGDKGYGGPYVSNWGHAEASGGGHGNQGLNKAGLGNQIYGSGYGGAYPAVSPKGFSGSGYGNTIPTHAGWGASTWDSHGYQSHNKVTPRINNVNSKGWPATRPNYGNYPNNKAWYGK